MLARHTSCLQFLALFLVNKLPVYGDMSIQPRIIGGFVTNIRQVKYLIQIATNDAICGGSLITSRWVITAAHCVYNVQLSELQIYGGTSEQGGQDGIRRRVNLVVIPPGFNINSMNMDVAALHLNRAMVGNNVETIQLARQPVPVGRLVKVSGWGVVMRNSSETARQVHSVVMPMRSRRACRAAYRGVQRITRSMVCASKPYARDSCDGDSGGPLVYRRQLAGIVSFGDTCASRLPGVYTSVPVIRRWFLNVIAQYS